MDPLIYAKSIALCAPGLWHLLRFSHFLSGLVYEIKPQSKKKAVLFFHKYIRDW